MADYLNVSVPDVDALDLIYYLRIRRDAFIARMNGSQAGREYLDEAWRLSRTEPDRKASREMFGKGDAHGEQD